MIYIDLDFVFHSYQIVFSFFKYLNYSYELFIVYYIVQFWSFEFQRVKCN